MEYKHQFGLKHGHHGHHHGQKLKICPIDKKYEDYKEVNEEYEEYVQGKFKNKDIPERVKSVSLWKLHGKSVD